MKKIIAIVLAVCVAVCTVLSAVCFAAFADDESTDTTMTEREFEIAHLYVLNQYKNGEITFSEYQEQSNALIDELYTSNTVGDVISSSAQKVGSTFQGITNKIGAVAETYGEAAYQYIADWITDFLDDYEVLSEETVINTDMNGYGAKMVIYDYYDGSSVVVGNPSYTSTKLTMYYVYGDYITYDPDYEHYNGYLGKYQVPSNQVTYWRPYYSSEFTTHGNSGSHCVGEHTKILVYGDVRYLDGTEAPSLEPSTTTTTSDLNFDNATDQDLVDLINNILEELERQTPDLSTIEGLLRAIYMQTCGINDKMITYDQCNALILSLISSNDENTQDIVNALFEIRDNLKNGGTSDSEDKDESEDETDSEDSEEEPPHPDHICGTLYNVKPLDKNWLNKLLTDKTELKVEYQGSKYYLESCGCLKLDDKYYSVDMNYDNYSSIDFDFSSDDISINLAYVDGLVDISPDITGNLNANAEINTQIKASLSSSQLNKLNQIVDGIKILINQAVPYSAVMDSISFYMPIIYNLEEPKDIVLTFDTFNLGNNSVDGFSITLLSTSIFESERAKEAITILRHFLTVVIIFSWLLSMRKKIVSSF